MVSIGALQRAWSLWRSESQMDTFVAVVVLAGAVAPLAARFYRESRR